MENYKAENPSGLLEKYVFNTEDLANIEMLAQEGSEKILLIREKDEKNEQAKAEQLIVIHGAKIKINAHLGEFNVLTDVPTTQDKPTGTIVENQIANFTFYDGFTLTSLAKFENFGNIKFQENEVILKKSTIEGVGIMPGSSSPENGKIEFINSGQIHVPESLNVDGAPLLDQKADKCIKCKNEITSELIRQTIGVKTLSTKQQNIINSVLPFINKYRKDFGLDTCLRKAHFVAQIGLECANFTTLEEGEEYWSTIKLGVFSSSKIQIDSTIINSLRSNLNSILKVVNNKGIEISKTNEELQAILLKEKPYIVDGEFYAKYKGEKDAKNAEKRNDKLIKEVFNLDKSINFKIYIKPHTYFGVPLLSRAYAPYTGDTRGLGNRNELSRDGWKFKGRGLKQLTGRGNYETFSKYRNKNTFPDDTTGEIDFTKEEVGHELKGSYLKISENPMYATQSALWFWNDGTKYNKKTAKQHADNDDVDSVSKAINRYDTDALPKRKANYNRAKVAFEIATHCEFLKK